MGKKNKDITINGEGGGRIVYFEDKDGAHFSLEEPGVPKVNYDCRDGLTKEQKKTFSNLSKQGTISLEKFGNLAELIYRISDHG